MSGQALTQLIIRCINDAPIFRFDIQASYFALGAGFVAAIGSSMLLALRLRIAASVAVVGCWSVFLVGAMGARIIVKPGPEYFERHIGTERFSVPWQYRPEPNGVGFFVFLCQSTLRGIYDENCRDAHQFTIRPRESGFSLIFDVRNWRMEVSEMKIGQVRHGHQTFFYTPPPDRPLRTPKQYLARYDNEGLLTRLVVCGYGRLCVHHALVRNYVFSYSIDESALPEWDMMDSKLADLVDAWRVP